MPFVPGLILANIINQNDKLESIDFKNKFLEKLLSNSYENWFAIESAYFEEVLKINEIRSDTTIKILNENLVQIKDWSKYYLSNQSKEFNTDKEVEYFFKTKFCRDKIDNLYVIDFNYTGVFKYYKKMLETVEDIIHGTWIVTSSRDEFKKPNMIRWNQIHGSLDSNIIFGYGDDRNEDYKRLKESGIKEYLKFFKTFEYMKSNNYQNIFRDAIDIY